jgi:protocatechuate 3,4-dioxygenase beta subunit
MLSNTARKFYILLLTCFSLIVVFLLGSCSSPLNPQVVGPNLAPSKPAVVTQPATEVPQPASPVPQNDSTQAATGPIPLTPTVTWLPTPDCSNPAALTPAMTEGPYYKIGSPERASLIEPGMTGTHLWVSGYVLTSNCQPATHALLDFWQANAQGQYDNNGYTLRGHEYTDENGYYRLETIVPGLYPGRTEHIHVKVQAPGGPLLTTQLFFPGVAQNKSDAIYSDQLLLAVQQTPDGLLATFNFIVKALP